MKIQVYINYYIMSQTYANNFILLKELENTDKAILLQYNIIIKIINTIYL